MDESQEQLEFAARRGVEAALAEMSKHLPAPEGNILPDAVRRTEALRRAADDYIPAIIAWFRQDLGATWEQVGEALGVSRQAAWERYHGRVAELETGEHTLTAWTRERLAGLDEEVSEVAVVQDAS